MKYLATLIKLLLTEPEANSRFVFAAQGIATAVVTVVLGVAYVMAHGPEKDGYATMLGTALGGGSLLHFGRMLTKKAGN